MLNTLFSLFKQEFAVDKIGYILNGVSYIINTFDEEYMKDKNTKNAAIDAVIEILQKHKDQ